MQAAMLYNPPLHFVAAIAAMQLRCIAALKPTLKPTQLLMLSDRCGVELPVATNEALQELLPDWKPHNSLDDESSHVKKRRRLGDKE